MGLCYGSLLTQFVDSFTRSSSHDPVVEGGQGVDKGGGWRGGVNGRAKIKTKKVKTREDKEADKKMKNVKMSRLAAQVCVYVCVGVCVYV